MNCPRIVRDPDILGGASRIEGTRIRPGIVVSFAFDGEAIQAAYSHLTPAQINAAICYELQAHRRLRRWLTARTAPVRYRIAAWMIGTDAETLREDAG